MLAFCCAAHEFSIFQDSVYNLDPERPEDVDYFTATKLAEEGKSLSDLETEIVEAPFVQVGAGWKCSPLVVDLLCGFIAALLAALLVDCITITLD